MRSTTSHTIEWPFFMCFRTASLFRCGESIESIPMEAVEMLKPAAEELVV